LKPFRGKEKTPATVEVKERGGARRGTHAKKQSISRRLGSLAERIRAYEEGSNPPDNPPTEKKGNDQKPDLPEHVVLARRLKTKKNNEWIDGDVWHKLVKLGGEGRTPRAGFVYGWRGDQKEEREKDYHERKVEIFLFRPFKRAPHAAQKEKGEREGGERRKSSRS